MPSGPQRRRISCVARGRPGIVISRRRVRRILRPVRVGWVVVCAHDSRMARLVAPGFT